MLNTNHLEMLEHIKHEKYPKKYNLVILDENSFQISAKMTFKELLKNYFALIGFFSLLAIGSFLVGYSLSLIAKEILILVMD